MRRVWFLGGFFLLGVLSSGAHCPQDPPPSIEFKYPSAGISVQTTCFVQFTFCTVDTFYQTRLHDKLRETYLANQHVILGQLDSLGAKYIFDSSYYNGALVAIDTLREESLWFSVLAQLKGSMPQQRLFFRDTLPYFIPGVSPTTYVGFVDTPLVAFFNDTAISGNFFLRAGSRSHPFIALFNDTTHVRELGIGPTEGCYFEPTAYMLVKGRILRKGIDGERMPGVSLSFDAFFGEVEPASVPSIVKIDTLTRNLRFRYGKTFIRRVSPGVGTRP